MVETISPKVREVVDNLYRTESRRVFATLVRLLGDFDLAEEALQDTFLIAPPTLAQRIVRAKAKIRDAGIPYQVPSRAELPERLDNVLQVIYLVFNKGYAASSGASLTRADPSGEAIRHAILARGDLRDYHLATPSYSWMRRRKY